MIMKEAHTHLHTLRGEGVPVKISKWPPFREAFIIARVVGVCVCGAKGRLYGCGGVTNAASDFIEGFRKGSILTCAAG